MKKRLENVGTCPAIRTQTIKVIGLIFYELVKNSAMNMHFNPIPIHRGLFLERRGAWDTPPQAKRRFRSSSLVVNIVKSFIYLSMFKIQMRKNTFWKVYKTLNLIHSLSFVIYRKSKTIFKPSLNSHVYWDT